VRKLVVILLGAGLGGATGWFLESRGAHPQVTTAVGSAITGGVAWLQERLEKRSQTTQEKVEKLIRGDAFESPVVTAIYVVLVLQVFQRVLGALVGGSIGLALAVRNVEEEETAEIVAVASPLVVFVLSLFVTAYVSYVATQRIRALASAWIGGALLVNTLINLGFAILVFDYIDRDWSVSALVVEGVVQFAALVAASLVGYWFARRSAERLILNRLVKELRPSDRRDLIDLVRTLPSVKQR
jgi:hypothetical protein